jgi:hypothetical protein
MINLITGVPGSGKTLLSLKLLTDKYFIYSKEVKTFFKRPEYQNITIITNIDTLKLEHKNLSDVMRQSGKDFESFFDYEYQKYISQKYPQIIYILDECQRYLSRRLPANTTLYFDMHRHLDHNIFLITQDFKKIHYDITSLIEFEYRLIKRSLSITGEFRYHVKINNEITATKGFRGTKKLFSLYKSFESNDNNIKTGNLYLKYLAIPCLILIISAFFLMDVLFSHEEKSVNDHPLTTIKEPLQLESSFYKKSSQKQSYLITNLIKKNNHPYYFQCPLTKRFFYTRAYPLPLKITPEFMYVTCNDEQKKQHLLTYPPIIKKSYPDESKEDEKSDRISSLLRVKS